MKISSRILPDSSRTTTSPLYRTLLPQACPITTPAGIPDSGRTHEWDFKENVMKRIVTPIAACAVVTLFVGPALAREHSHHQRHAIATRHSHHHWGRAFAYSRHWHRGYRRFATVQQPAAQTFNPFWWLPQSGGQQQPAQRTPLAAPAPIAPPSLGFAQPGFQQPAVTSMPRTVRRLA